MGTSSWIEGIVARRRSTRRSWTGYGAAGIDIESDDVEQEVKRLEALGAKRVEPIKTWWVMEAPTGHRFCVVKPQRDGTVPDDANEWS